MSDPLFTPEEFQAYILALHQSPMQTALPAERQQELICKGIVALLEESAVAFSETCTEPAFQEIQTKSTAATHPVHLLEEAAASHSFPSVRLQAFQALVRLAEAEFTPAINALYSLAVEKELPAARQALQTRGWQPDRPELRALFDWFSALESSAAYPEEKLPALTRAFFQTASPALQRRLLATAHQNRADHWAAIVAALQEGNQTALERLVEAYPTFRPTERQITLDGLVDCAGQGAEAAKNALVLLFIRQEENQARDILLAQAWVPEDAEQRALFLFLAGQWAAYEALDFDHSLLSNAYEAAGRSLRRRLLEHSRQSGRMEWIRGLGSADEVRWITDLTDADWELSMRRLNEAQKYSDLWRLAQVAPPVWSAAMLRQISASQWQPEQADERAEYIHLVQLAQDCQVKKLDIRPLKALHAPVNDFTCLAIHPAGRILAAGSSDARVYLWDLPDGNLSDLPLIGPVPVTRAITFSPDGEIIACASGDNKIRAFRLENRLLLKTFEGHRAMIRALAIHPDGRTLFSAGFDGNLRSWRFPHGSELKSVHPGPGEIFSMVLGNNGSHLISAGADCMLRVWSLPDVIAARELLGHTGTITHLAASPNGELVASASRDGWIRLWNFTSGGQLRAFPDATGSLTALCFHPNDQVLIGGRNDGEIVLWNLSTGKVLTQLNSHRQAITGLALSPSGDTLYSVDRGGQLRVWDLNTFLTIHLPGETAIPGAAQKLQDRLKNPNRSPEDQKWLQFSAELARWRERFDIEVAEFQPVQIGEFDIEL